MARREQKRLSQPLPRSRARYAMTPHSLAGEMTCGMARTGWAGLERVFGGNLWEKRKCKRAHVHLNPSPARQISAHAPRTTSRPGRTVKGARERRTSCAAN